MLNNYIHFPLNVHTDSMCILIYYYITNITTYSSPSFLGGKQETQIRKIASNGSAKQHP